MRVEMTRDEALEGILASNPGWTREFAERQLDRLLRKPKVLSHEELQESINEATAVRFAAESRAYDGTPAVEYAGGAKRSEVKPAYHLMQPDLIERSSRVWAIGAQKYGPYNWQKGDLEFAKGAVDHAYEHWLKFVEGDQNGEDHLAHLMCNLQMIAHFEKVYGKQYWRERPQDESHTQKA